MSQRVRRRSGAEEVYRRADERGHGCGAVNYGFLIEARDPAGAEAAYRRADQRGEAMGASNLGNMLRRRGEFAAAEEAFARAEQPGLSAGPAGLGLGTMLAKRDDLEGALQAYQRADNRGDAAGALFAAELYLWRKEPVLAEAPISAPTTARPQTMTLTSARKRLPDWQSFGAVRHGSGSVALQHT